MWHKLHTSKRNWFRHLKQRLLDCFDTSLTHEYKHERTSSSVRDRLLWTSMQRQNQYKQLVRWLSIYSSVKMNFTRVLFYRKGIKHVRCDYTFLWSNTSQRWTYAPYHKRTLKAKLEESLLDYSSTLKNGCTKNPKEINLFLKVNGRGIIPNDLFVRRNSWEVFSIVWYFNPR